jgi:hypothetical protein
MVQDTYKRVVLNGTTSYVSVPTHASLLPDANYMTIGARIYIDINQNYNRIAGIVAKSTSGPVDLGYSLYYDDRVGIKRRSVNFVVYHSAVSYDTVYAENLITESGWYDIVATYDTTLGADNMKLFINAVRVAVKTYNQTVVASVQNVAIGSWSGGAYPIWGHVAQAFIYNRTLSEAEVNYAYLHPNNPKRRGLVMSLVQTSIDKPAAGTWKDVSPQTGNNGTITNATTSKYPAISAGRNAIFCPTNTYSDRVDCGNGASLDPSTTGLLSGEIWIKFPSQPTNAVFMSKHSGANGYYLQWNTATKLLYLVVGAGFGITSVAGLNIIGQWVHICFTYTSGAATGKMYVNGVDKTSASVALALANPATNLLVGNYSSLTFSPVGGYIASFRVYNRTLTAEEVLYNYHHPNNPKRRGLVLNLSQESLYGTRWYDLSGNANDGTITGAIAKNIADSLTGD